MFNFILNFTLGIVGLFVFFNFFEDRISWKKLSIKYKVNKDLSNDLFLTKGNAFINRASVKGLNIGVSEEGLFLSFPFPIDFILPTLLIPWDEISYGKENNRDRGCQYFVFNLGSPKITELQLSSKTLENIHENYGSSIFFDRLGNPNQKNK